MPPSFSHPLPKADVDLPTYDESIWYAPSAKVPVLEGDPLWKAGQCFYDWATCARAVVFRTLITLGWVCLGDDRMRDVPVNHGGAVDGIKRLLGKVCVPKHPHHPWDALMVLEQWGERSEDYTPDALQELRDWEIQMYDRKRDCLFQQLPIGSSIHDSVP